MSKKTTGGLGSLGRDAAGILALATLAWCLAGEMSFTEALFRSVVIYIAVSIISIILQHQLARLLLPPTAQPVGDPEDVANENSQ